MRSTVRLSSHCLTALPPRLPPRVDSPYPTLPLHSPARADPLWTQSGARDFYRDQARASGRRVESIPVSTNYFAEGANFPSHELRCVARLPPSFPMPPLARHAPPNLDRPSSPRRDPHPLSPSERSHPSPSFPPLLAEPSATPSPPAATSRATSAPRRRAARMPRRVARSVPRRPSRAHTARNSSGGPFARPPPEAGPRPPRTRSSPHPRPSRGTTTRARPPVARTSRAPPRTPPRLRASTPALSRLALERSARNPITANPRRRRYLTSPISSFPSVRPRAKRRSTPNTTWMATRPKF